MKEGKNNMNEIIISIVFCAIQIVLSSLLVLRNKNKIAILSEITTSMLLFYILYSIENVISWKYIILVASEIIAVKLFLIIFFLITRKCSF